jgi:hypothetical protein
MGLERYRVIHPRSAPSNRSTVNGELLFVIDNAGKAITL